MPLSRRSLLAAAAASLLAPRVARRAASVADATGRMLPSAGASRARVSGRAAGGDPALYAGARPAARLAARQPAGGAPICCPTSAPRRSRPHHRARQHRQSGGGAGAQARPDPRRRLDPRDLRVARRAVQAQTGIPYALLDGRFDAIPASLSHARRADRPAGRRRGLARYCRRHHEDDHPPHRDSPAGQAPARLLRARAARAGHRAGRLDQCRDHRAPGAECRRRHARRPRQCLDRAGAAVESGCHRHHRPGLRRDRARRSGLGGGRGGARRRVHLSPKLPFGWVDFPPREPPDRAVVARQDSLSRLFPEDLPA